MNLRLPIFLIVLGLTALPHRTNADPVSLPVARVTLYTSGVGYFERAGTVDGDASQTLLFPIGQINDVLKSLVLLDNGGGKIAPVTYGAQDPVGKQLQSFSVDLSDNPNQATLLNRLRGAKVTVTVSEGTTDQTVSGVIVGVETQTVTVTNGGTTQQSTLTLMTETGLQSLLLAHLKSVQFDDPKLRDDIRQALNVVAQGRDTSKRPVTLNFRGTGHRSVLVGYLTEAALWQTSYRLVLGQKPILQGWAMVQNTTQDDWNGVHLSLVSGRPISFIQDLYTPLYLPRPVVQASVTASPTPQAYGSSMLNGNLLYAPVSDAAKPASPADAPENDKSPITIHLSNREAGSSDSDEPSNANFKKSMLKVQTTANGAQLGTSLFAYNIDTPVTVPRQQSAMIPFVAQTIQATPVSIYNQTVQDAHPLSGARLKNTTGLHLMGGPLTVFDESNGQTQYVGDALIDDTEPNQTRLISYAVDLAVDAAVEDGPTTGQITTVVISEGTLIVRQQYEGSTIYTFKNHSATPRTIVVEQTYNGEGWKLLEPSAATERTANLYRFDVPVAAGASKKFTVRESYPEAETYALLDTDPGTLLTYSRSGEASPAVKDALQSVIAKRQNVAHIQNEIHAMTAQVQSLALGQSRIRENMKTLDHASALYKRYVGELDSQETHLNELQDKLAQRQNDLAQAQNDLSNTVSHMSLK